MIVFFDPGSSRLYWQLSYNDLSTVEANALRAHFEACAGPVRAFTFIDPTDNMLAWSSDLTAAVWTKSSLVQVASGIADPVGSSFAFTVTNNSQVTEEVTQTLTVPANYQYCFSLYALTAPSSPPLTLVRRGPSPQASTPHQL